MKPEWTKIDGATGIQWRERDGGWVPYWVADAKAVARGFLPKTLRIVGDPLREAPSQKLRDFIRTECERLHAEMLTWKAGGISAATTMAPDDIKQHFNGTVRSLSRCYQIDPVSKFHRLRYRTQVDYMQKLKAIEGTVGDRALANLDERWFLHCFQQWKLDADGSEHVPRAAQRMAIFRVLIKYGATLLADPACRRIASFLCGNKEDGVAALLQFEGVAQRTVTLTADHVIAIRKMAHQRGRPEIALAEAFKFDLALRPKDVVGEWIPLAWPGTSAVTRGKWKWVCGIDWSQITRDLVLSHVYSKSKRGKEAIGRKTKKAKTRGWDLKLSPMIMEELQHVPVEQRVGPLIKNSSTGYPFANDEYGSEWRKVADAAGIPKNVQCRDARAGAITEAVAVAGLESGRKVGGHSDINTTKIYEREDDETTAKVMVLRARARRQNG